ncbi:MAG: bacillithiol transferase BstA [Candidatus Acidiferrales bacterium]
METDLRYPIGKFSRPGTLTDDLRRDLIEEIAAAPAKLGASVQGLTAAQLDTPYRPGGWTVRQVVHHVPDSHMNAYTRFRLALTEDEPTIKPYDEGKWAELRDAKSAAIEPSLALLEGLHERWVLLLRSLGPAEWPRQFRHPEQGRLMSLDDSLALYAWHGKHHVAHITALRAREGWA